MNWNTSISDGEILCWEGRPMPRAFTFRNWRYSLVGLVLLVVAICWHIFTLSLADGRLTVVPISFILIALYLSFGHLLLARLEWNQVGYAVSDRRLLARRGLFRRRVESFKLDELTSFQVKPMGAELASIHAFSVKSGKRLSFIAVEQPAALLTLLEVALTRNGHELSRRPL